MKRVVNGSASLEQAWTSKALPTPSATNSQAPKRRPNTTKYAKICTDSKKHFNMQPRFVGPRVVLGPLELRWLRIAPNGEGSAVHLHAALVHLLREHTISRMHEDHRAILLQAVDLVVLNLHLPQLLAQSNALLLLPEVAQVLPLVHDAVTTCGHLKLNLVLCSPSDSMALAGGLGHVSTSVALKHGELWRVKEVLRAWNRFSHDFLALCTPDDCSTKCQQCSTTHSRANAAVKAALCWGAEGSSRLCHWSTQAASGAAWDHEGHSCDAQHSRSQTHCACRHGWCRSPSEEATRTWSKISDSHCALTNLIKRWTNPNQCSVRLSGKAQSTLNLAWGKCLTCQIQEIEMRKTGTTLPKFHVYFSSLSHQASNAAWRSSNLFEFVPCIPFNNPTKPSQQLMFVGAS